MFSTKNVKVSNMNNQINLENIKQTRALEENSSGAMWCDKIKNMQINEQTGLSDKMCVPYFLSKPYGMNIYQNCHSNKCLQHIIMIC